MSSPVMVPGDWGDSATAPSAAELITAINLPGIERFSSAFPGFAELPAYAPFADPTDLSAVPRLTKVQVTREVMDECAAALAAVQLLEARTAACKAALIERFHTAAQAEEAALGLDRWQSMVSSMSARAEIAAVLTIGEGVAGVLIEQSLALVRELPASWEHLRDGELSWGHAVVIAEETGTLRGSGIPAEAIDAYEQALLGKTPGCTLPSFRDKARRLREKSHPESITTRTKAAYGRRRMGVQRVQDGMSWLNVHLPAPTVEGIWDQCTFLAHNAQGPGESRSLTQLRADIAATLLLGQSLEANGINDHRARPEPTIAPTPATDTATAPNPGTAPDPEPSSVPDPVAGAGPATVGTRSEAGALDVLQDYVAGRGLGVGSGSVRVPAAGDVGFPGFDPTGTAQSPAMPEDYAQDARLMGNWREPDPGDPGSWPGRFYTLDDWQVPVFPTPNYYDPAQAAPGLWDPDPAHTFSQDATVPGTGANGTPPTTDTAWSNDSGTAPSTTSGTLGPQMPGPVRKAGGSGAVFSGLPPMPAVMPVLLIPALSLVGASNDPATLEGYGPISIDVAKRLLAEAPCFYRAFTDPMTGEALALSPETRRVGKKMRIMLRATNEFCTFPGCTAKAAHSELDHLTPWASGGLSVPENLEPLDKRHHLLKHFKDDRTREGRRRKDQSPERAGMKLRGWTPTMTESGRPGWTSPTGRYYPPQPLDTDPPSYPKWLAKTINTTLAGTPTITGTGTAGGNKPPAGTGARRDATRPRNRRRRPGPIDLSPAEALIIKYLAS